MRWISLIALCALSGCATDSGPRPAVEVRTVTVDRPVAVRCVNPADIVPAPPKVGGQLNGDAVHDLSVVAELALKLRSALEADTALLNGCKVQ